MSLFTIFIGSERLVAKLWYLRTLEINKITLDIEQINYKSCLCPQPQIVAFRMQHPSKLTIHKHQFLS